MGSSKAQDIKILMQEWIAERPETRDTSQLAKKSGLEYNTVRRIWTGSNPDCQTALALLNVITSKDKALEYLRAHFPHAAAFHEKENTTHTFYADAESLRPAIEDLTSFVILNLAYAGHATREKITKAFGDLGMQAVKELIATEQVIWTSEEKLIPTRSEEFFSYENKHDLIKACKHIVTLSRSDKGFPVAFMGALSDDEVATAKRLTREYCIAIKNLFLNSRGGTNMVGLASIFVSLFDAEEQS